MTVRFGDQTKKATVGEFEHWRVTLDPMPASRKGSRSRHRVQRRRGKTVRDVVVGDVWVLTGTTRIAGELISPKTRPEPIELLREFRIKTKARRFREPRKRRMEIGGGKYRSSWRAATFTEERIDTSVAGYVFASQVQQEGVRSA